MESRVLLFVGLIALAACNDIKVGAEDGEKIFDKKEEKGWAMSTQNDNVTITVNDTEVITGVNVTDLREKKDGEAKIVDGGVGQKNVTINLKSPAALRGYDFHIEVYAASEEEYTKKGSNNYKIHDLNTNKQVPVAEPKNEVSSTKSPPVNLAKDMIVHKREAKEQSQSTAAPKLSTTTGSTASFAKDGKDSDESSVVPLMPITNGTDYIAKSDNQGTETKQAHPSPYNFSETADVISIDGFQTSSKNVDTKTIGGTVVSLTPRNTRKTNEASTATVKPESATGSVGVNSVCCRKSGEGIDKLADPAQVNVGKTEGIPTLAKNVNVDAKSNAPSFSQH